MRARRLTVAGVAVGALALPAAAQEPVAPPAAIARDTARHAAARESLPYDAMAARIVAALAPSRGERAILGFDAEALPEFVPVLRRALEPSGVTVDTVRFGDETGFEDKLSRSHIYVWLPARPGMGPSRAQGEMLGRWLDSGRGRAIHFHWTGITTAADGFPAAPPSRYGRMLADALDVDYRALAWRIAGAARRLRAGEVRVTTPSGTDLRFRLGDRPVSRQDGNAARAHLRGKRLRIDREVELPAGALRVAPIEETVNGTMVIPRLRFSETDTTAARDVRLEFAAGKIVRMTAASHERELRDSLFTAYPALNHFREFALGFNPKLLILPGEVTIPYAGYGAGVVRLSLGDNSELGGKVRGGTVLWLFFADATVAVGNDVLVRNGRLVR